MGQKWFKKGRVILSLLFLIALLIAFSDIKGRLPEAWFITVMYLQVIPSVLKFITQGVVLSVGFLIVILLTLVGGRIYCSTICPVGTLQDIVIWVRTILRPKRRMRYRKPLNLIRYPLLGTLLISLLFLGVLFLNWLDPYANFGRMGTHLFQPLFLEINNLLSALNLINGIHIIEPKPFHLASFAFATGFLLLIGIMALLRERLYCNTICPVGAVLGLLSKLSLYKIRIDASGCNKCGKCQAVCKAGCIDIKTLSIDESRCVGCFNCISACNNNATGYSLAPVKSTPPAEPLQPDNTRRFLLASSLLYLASKALPAYPSGYQERNRERRHSGHKENSPPHGGQEYGRKRRNSGLHCDGDKDPYSGYHQRGTVTPPGSLSVTHLKSRCVACHLCIAVCPTKVLQSSWLEYGFTGMLLPKMDFDYSFCNYDCTKCGEACPTGAIIRLSADEKRITQIGKVKFLKRYCIVHTDGTACGSCSEHCPTQAVKMVPYRNGLTIPEIDTSICIGCGACEFACPVTDPHKAIFVVASSVHGSADKPSGDKLNYEHLEEFPF